MNPGSHSVRYRIWAAAVLALSWFAATATQALGVGDEAPPFALPTAQGQTIALAQLRGQVVYVDFWASWCAPCRRSFPWMNEIKQRYGQQGVSVVAINVDEKRAEADRFLERYPATFTVVFDSTGATPSAYGAKAMPSSYLVDRDGRIAAVEYGFRETHAPALEAKIRALADAR